MKVIKLKNISLNEDLDFDDGDYQILEDEDGKLWYFDENKWKRVPHSIEIELIRDKEEQERINKLKDEDPDFDEESERENAKARYNEPTSQEYKGLQDETIKVKNTEVISQKRAQDRKISNKKKSLPNLNPSLELMQKQVTDFVNSFLDNSEDKVSIVRSYQRPDVRRSSIDPSILSKGRVRRHNTISPDKPKPLVLFFFDRSGSFDETYHKGKTKLGKDLIKLFQYWRDTNQVECKLFYFASAVREASSLDAPCRGGGDMGIGWGNDPQALLDTVKSQTEGRRANVVILTDIDNSSMQGTCKVDGAVWLVFAGEGLDRAYDSGLKNHIFGSELTKEFIFDDLT